MVKQATLIFSCWILIGCFTESTKEDSPFDREESEVEQKVSDSANEVESVSLSSEKRPVSSEKKTSMSDQEIEEFLFGSWDRKLSPNVDHAKDYAYLQLNEDNTGIIGYYNISYVEQCLNMRTYQPIINWYVQDKMLWVDYDTVNLPAYNKMKKPSDYWVLRSNSDSSFTCSHYLPIRETQKEVKLRFKRAVKRSICKD